MAKALIAKDEIVNHYDGTLLGLRIVDVFENEIFIPQENHFWIDCENGLNWSEYYYNEINKSIEKIPVNPNWAIEKKLQQEYEAKIKTKTISSGAIVV